MWVTDETGRDVDLDAFPTLTALRAALPGQRWITTGDDVDVDLDSFTTLTELRAVLDLDGHS